MGYIVLVAVLTYLGFIILPVLQETFRLHFLAWYYKGTAAVPKDLEIKAEPPPKEIEVPLGIVAYARSWGAEWVEHDTIERAKRLYAEHNNWELVFQELLKQDGESKVNA